MKRLGPFILERSIGRGALGEVHVALTAWPNAPIAALKVLRPELDSLPGLLSRLEHPNIVSLLEAGTAGGAIYLAYELVLGKSVAEICTRQKYIPFPIAVRVLGDVLGALAWLHERRLHGAVTPGNVLVTYGGAAKLADTGVAAAALAASPTLDRKEIVLDAEYLAPEVLSGGALTASADLYALGSTFERMASAAKTPLEGLIARMRAPDPADRPQGARSALESLQRIAQGEHAPASRVAVGRWLSDQFAREKAAELAEVETLKSERDEETDMPAFGATGEDPTTSTSWPERAPGFDDEATIDDTERTAKAAAPRIEGSELFAALPQLATGEEAPLPAMPRLATVPPLEGDPISVLPRDPNVRTKVLSDEDDRTQRSLITAAPGAGATFGPYALISKMGEGGMAEVLLAEKRGDGGEVSRCVIKRISSVLRNDREFRNMFLEESRIARMIHHPNVVECFDAGTIDGVSYMALELVEGLDAGALVGRLAPQRLEIGAALEIGIAVAGALDHAHNLKDTAGRPLDLVHRDVSPENILISWSGEVKLLDFGISRFKDRNYATQIGVRKGKLGYMAPEYVQGAALDARADVFQLGVTLVEILRGKRLFESDDLRPREFSVMRAVLEEHLAPAGPIPPELFELLAKMCAPDPKDRPASAGEVAGELEEIAAALPRAQTLGEIVGLLAPTTTTRRVDRRTDLLPAPRRRSNPMLVPGLLLLAIVLIAFAVAFFLDR